MANNRIAEEHKRRNEETRCRRAEMAGHRAHVMQLIRDARNHDHGSLCILGAGNGNDIELPQLARMFETITLVDLDEAALDVADKKVESPSSSVRRIGGIDVTGVFETIAGLGADSIDTSAIEAAIELAGSVPAPDIGTFDVVCSTCLLSQLIDSICMAMPADHPRFVELILAIRNRHLNLIGELLTENGIGILITDFVSSRTTPELVTLADDQLPNAAMRWIKERNFFTGINPFILRSHYQKDRSVEFLQLTRPWKWDIGVKQFAVCALTIRRVGTSTSTT